MKKLLKTLQPITWHYFTRSLSPALIPLTPLLFASLAQSASVTLEWDANIEPELKGYRLYYGLRSRTTIDYPCSFEAGNKTTYTITDLRSGRRYYFAVTAYDMQNRESEYSVELSYKIPKNDSDSSSGDGFGSSSDSSSIFSGGSGDSSGSDSSSGSGGSSGGSGGSNADSDSYQEATIMSEIVRAWRPGNPFHAITILDKSTTPIVLRPRLDLDEYITGNIFCFAAIIINGQLFFAETDLLGRIVFVSNREGYQYTPFSVRNPFNGSTWTCEAFEKAFDGILLTPALLTKLEVTLLFGVSVEPFGPDDLYIGALQWGNE